MTWWEHAQAFGVELTEDQIDQFDRYATELIEWNRKINLTAITDPDEILIRHFLDSVSCNLVLAKYDLTGKRLIDVGTGAGFPGLPIKLIHPELDVTLVDSVGKKIDFLGRLSQKLGVAVNRFADRAEAFGRLPAHREAYDWVVARSVAELRTLSEYLLPLCRVGGFVLAQKGEHAPEEVERGRVAVETVGGVIRDVTEVVLPGRDIPHYLVFIEKVAPTPAKYPRRIGVPSKRPLD